MLELYGFQFAAQPKLASDYVDDSFASCESTEFDRSNSNLERDCEKTLR